MDGFAMSLEAFHSFGISRSAISMIGRVWEPFTHSSAGPLRHLKAQRGLPRGRCQAALCAGCRTHAPVVLYTRIPRAVFVSEDDGE